MIAEELFSIPDNFPFKSYFGGDDTPWSWVGQIRLALESSDFVAQIPIPASIPPGVVIEGAVFIDPSVVLSPNVVIQGPAYIGAGTEIRPGAFIRGNVIVGENCVLGNCSEFKNCLLLNNVQAPHYNYVGDSILGNGAHLAAGVICSNLRLDQANVPIKLNTGHVDSGLRKLGALVGDEAEIGCNTVLNPGAVLGKRSIVYPSMSFDGVLEADSIAAVKQEMRIIKRR
ncbi:MAG: UDP-N-acetylglucosamine diphosphorylase [Verrucomicrobia bacterium]|nr:UDP-N-acetylglucosamine diphosphorylase [Verrucomicrobiota bacterium]MDA1064894.1 UDP-N-acetylglucosamine diphosphorylase [Verrucomicrobiota bacterium]